jgi:hypothetical protein
MCRPESSAFPRAHKSATTKQVPRVRQDRPSDAITGAFLENRRMAKAVMIPRGNGLLRSIIRLGREPRPQSANRGLLIYPVGLCGRGVFLRNQKPAVWTCCLREVTIHPRQRMLIEIGNGKHWMRRRQHRREEQASVDNGGAGACGSYSPRPTLVLDEKPDGKHGSEVTYRSVMTSASAAISFRSLLIS